MKADDCKLEQLLEGSQQFVVPLFQRVYSWKKKNWDELWRDLLDIYDHENDGEHFMGAIVTMPVKMQPHGVSKYLLIDGQQRLTTIFIILACIRDLVGKDNKLFGKIEGLYLINKWEKDGNRQKLLPTQADRGAFLEIIDRKAKSDSNVGNVYNYFIKALKGKDDEDNPIDLENFQKAMINQLVFVSIVLDANDSPYRIFHSLNGTGVPLTQADLVRNHFFMLIPVQDQSVAHKDFWLPMQNSLGNTLTDFMWRFITKDGTFVKQNGVYDAIRRRTLQKSSDAIDVLMDMNIYSEYYRKVVHPAKEPNNEIRTRLEHLNQWEVNTSYPLLLNLYHDLHSKKISVDEFCEIVDAIESFVIRRFFCNIPTNALNKYFIQIYRNIASSANIVEATYEFLLARKFPTDETFVANWIRYPIFMSGTKKSRHILESLETAISNNNEPVDMSHSRITREHIMPQNLSLGWSERLGRDAISVHSQYLHTVGNLTLTGQNESMGNKSFSEKKKVFANSSFALNSYFQNCDVWNEEEIIKRARYLGEIATKIWKRPTN